MNIKFISDVSAYVIELSLNTVKKIFVKFYFLLFLLFENCSGVTLFRFKRDILNKGVYII